MGEPSKPKRQDPLALAVIIAGVVIVLLCAGFLLRSLLSADRVPDAPAAGSYSDAARRALEHVTAMVRELQQDTPDGGSPPADRPPAGTIVMKPETGSGRPVDPRGTFPAIAAPQGPHVARLPEKGIWIYHVSFGPAWQYAGQLYYQTDVTQDGKLGAKMSWTPNGGSTSTWFLGVVEANHASHGNTRFPGFFMHPAYFPAELAKGDVLAWEFPWQAANATGRERRVRHFEMIVVGWERVEVPFGKFDAARLEGTLRYLENEDSKATVRYTLWYAPQTKQVVRLVWLGRTPDEGQSEMAAELNFYGAR